MRAERQLYVEQTRNLKYSWEMENYRQDAQRRRDKEIGDMGGGG